MNFAFSEEQEELRQTIRRFLEDKSPSTEVRRLMETVDGYDEAVWKQMGQELGLQSLHIPEEYGGQGFTFVELGIVLEEMGRVLLCAPYFSTVVLAADAILNAGTDDQKAGAPPGHRVGRDPRRARLHRAQRPVGRVGHHARGQGRRWLVRFWGLRARRHQELRDRRPHRRPHRGRGAHRGNERRGRHRLLHRRRRRRRSHPDAARDDGPDPQAGEARVLRA